MSIKYINVWKSESSIYTFCWIQGSQTFLFIFEKFLGPTLKINQSINQSEFQSSSITELAPSSVMYMYFHYKFQSLPQSLYNMVKEVKVVL